MKKLSYLSVIDNSMKRLFSQWVIYGLGSAVASATSFILLPFYTRLLAIPDYGRLELFNVIAQILSLSFNLGMSSALFYGIYKLAETEEDVSKVFSTSFISVATVILFAATGLSIVAGYLSNFLLKDIVYARLFRVVILSASLNTLTALTFAFFRGKQRPFAYSLLLSAQLLFNMALTLYFLVVLRKGLVGIIYAQAIASVMAFALSIASIARVLKLQFSYSYLRKLLVFGLPLVPTGFALWVMDLSDRYFLQHFLSAYHVGVYSLGYKIGAIIQIGIAFPFGLAWPAYLFWVAKNKSETEAKETYSKIFLYIMLLASFVWLFLSVFSREIITKVAAGGYVFASPIVPLVAGGYIFYLCYLVFAVGINLTAKTGYATIVFVTGALINILLNITLIPILGIMGAAFATLFSYAAMAAMTYYFSQKLYRVRYPFGKISAMVIAAVFAYLACSFFGKAYIKLLIIASYCLFIQWGYTPVRINRGLR